MNKYISTFIFRYTFNIQSYFNEYKYLTSCDDVQPMNYSSSSPGNYGGPPGSTGPPGPGTPIMPSPQDSSNSGGENMYTMMKPVPGGNMPGVSD